MANGTETRSLRTAALIAGLAILGMAIAAPFAEVYVYPRLIVPNNPAETVGRIMANEGLFVSGILGYLTTFTLDVVAAWALYVLLRPVNGNLSLLTAWFRLVYAVIAVVALLNLVTIWRLLNTAGHTTVSEPGQLYAQVGLLLIAFKSGWSLGILFFGIHLGLLGYLVLRSNYIPAAFGVLLVIAGLGYLITTLGPFVFPNVNLHVARYTFVGELIFMLWLLVKGSRIQESGLFP